MLLARQGDWARIRYGAPDDPGGGVAWTRLDMADGARVRAISWQDALDDARGVVFRSTTAHNLRADPRVDAALVEQLSGDGFDMDVLAIRGDWMRVRVHEPPACAGTAASDLLLGGGAGPAREQQGWVAWRSDDRGPWVRPSASTRCGR
jgi:hypothetical protein